jgi:hypothetical protein
MNQATGRSKPEGSATSRKSRVVVVEASSHAEAYRKARQLQKKQDAEVPPLATDRRAAVKAFS